MNNTHLIKGATIVTMDRQGRVIEGDVLVEDGRISKVSPSISAGTDSVIDARGRVLLPGFIQTHVHLCQTLFRGAADDLPLLDWLKTRIWPMEAAHTDSSVYASAQLGIAELIKGGTTAALTMETVHHTDAVFRAVEESGFRAIVGKCMMDRGQDVPRGLIENPEDSIAESLRLLERWHGRGDGRIRYCLAPRFALSCSRALLERVAVLAGQRGVLVHTHASENLIEVDLIRRETERGNIEFLSDVGLASENVVLAHCVHVSEAEIDILERTGTRVAHCPSSNLKLGSGIAPVPRMLERGICVSLGSDGAACNNRLDMFTEMRLAALIQKPAHGPQSVPAIRVLEMATLQGARALGLEDTIGSIELGKRADLTILNLDRTHTTPRPDVISTIVYSASPSNVETVLIDGRIVMQNAVLTTLSEQAVTESASREALNLFARADGH
jgi:5-methylthioadenosine/S-adenosylhomocysteine deaminase